MKLVKERLFEKFTEDGDPIEDMGIGNIGIYKELEKRGVRFHFDWGERTDRKISDGEIEKQLTIKNIGQITEVINKLEDVGVKPSNIRISRHNSIMLLNAFQVISSNTVIAFCASIKDAAFIIDILKKFTIREYDNLTIDTGMTTVSIDPEKHQWLDKLIENRKKYKI
jgi:hypothetical protein